MHIHSTLMVFKTKLIKGVSTLTNNPINISLRPRPIYLLWHWTSVYPVSFERPPRLMASCDKPCELRTITGFPRLKSLFIFYELLLLKFIQISLLRYHCLQLFSIKLLQSLSFWWVLVLFLHICFIKTFYHKHDSGNLRKMDM